MTSSNNNNSNKKNLVQSFRCKTCYQTYVKPNNLDEDTMHSLLIFHVNMHGQDTSKVSVDTLVSTYYDMSFEEEGRNGAGIG